MLRLPDTTGDYRRLDAAPVIKHAYALTHTYQDRPVVLLYLFREHRPRWIFLFSASTDQRLNVSPTAPADRFRPSPP